MADERFSIVNTTKGKLPRLPFAQMKDAALGKSYELSLVFISEAKARALDKKWRGKDEVANVLSFPLSETSGEILICPRKAKREAKKYDRKPDNFLAFLFIHGLAHLKGHDHGDEMEQLEVRLRKKFSI